MSEREKPLNLKQVDESVFCHEYKKNIAEIHLLTINSICISGNGIVIAPNYKRIPDEFEKVTNILRMKPWRYFALLVKQFIKRKINRIRTPVIFVVENYNTAYFHWMTETLPRLIAAENYIKDVPVFLPENYKQYSFIDSSLKSLGFNISYQPPGTLAFANKNFFITQFATAGNYHDAWMQKLRQRFVEDCNYHAVPSKKIYISRKKAGRRRIANEDEILPLLIEMGFEIVYCEELTLKQQVDVFAQTKLLVSNHGAGLTNLLFMPAASAVLELRHNNDSHNNCYFTLASAMKIHYYYQSCRPVHDYETPHLADLNIDKTALHHLLSVIIEKENINDIPSLRLQ